MAKNARLLAEIEGPLAEARRLWEETGRASRLFKDFEYQTLKSWSRARRVVGKAEHLDKGANPRFVVTSIASEILDARARYEREYCARGDMENRIEEQQLDLFADRTSTSHLRSNQLRLRLSSLAYMLVTALRELGLKNTTLARAQCATIRAKLLKIGAQIRVRVRRVWVSLAEGCPCQTLLRQVWKNLRRLVPLRC